MTTAISLTQLPLFKRGDPITADYLSHVSRNINGLIFLVRQNENEQLTDGRLDATGSGDMEVIGNSDSGLPLDPSKIWVEKSRVTDIVRVESPDDPDVYVDVRRIRIVTSTNLLGEIDTRVYEAE